MGRHSPSTPLSFTISRMISTRAGSSSYIVSSSSSLESASCPAPVAAPFPFPFSFSLSLPDDEDEECVCLRTVTLDKGVVQARERIPAKAPAARSCPGVRVGAAGRFPLGPDGGDEDSLPCTRRATIAARKKKKRKLESCQRSRGRQRCCVRAYRQVAGAATHRIGQVVRPQALVQPCDPLLSYNITQRTDGR